MRQLGTAIGVLLVISTLALSGCGSASAHTAPTTTVHPTVTRHTPKAPPTSRPVTTTTRVNRVAADELTQLVLMSALNAAKSIYDRTYDFTDVSPTSLTPLVPNVRFAALDRASRKVVGILAQDRNDVLFVTRSKSGRWYCVTDNDEDGVSYGAAPAFADLNSNGECQAPAWPAPGS